MMSNRTEDEWREHDMESNTIVAGRPGVAVADFNAIGRPAEENRANFQLCLAAPELEASLIRVLGLIRKAQERLCEHLHPDSCGDDHECMNDMLTMFDGPEQRDIEKQALAAINKAAARVVVF